MYTLSDKCTNGLSNNSFSLHMTNTTRVSKYDKTFDLYLLAKNLKWESYNYFAHSSTKRA